MVAKKEPVSGLSYGWALGEDDWNVGMDSNLIKLGATLQISVTGFAAFPTDITAGTRYIVQSGTGVFTGKDGKLAVRVETSWYFYDLQEGCFVYNKDNKTHYKYENSQLTPYIGMVSSTTFAGYTPVSDIQKFVYISEDETNGDAPTLYFYDGTNLNWIPMVGV